MSFVKVQVAASRRITPGMVRITFAGPEIAGFVSTGVADEFVRAFFPNPETGALPIPRTDHAGRAVFPEGTTAPHNEYYTIRRIGSGEIDIDFVVHEGGLASEWAQAAAPGDCIVLGKPNFCYEPPADIIWQVLLADATGLPALGRILDETPAHVATTAIIEVAGRSHLQDLREAAHIECRWLFGSGNGVGPSALLQAFRNLTLPPGEGYIWMAGEMHASREIRRHLRGDLGLTGRNFSVVRYWVDDKKAWLARWKGLDPAVRDDIETLWESGRDPDEINDIWHDMLEKHGL